MSVLFRRKILALFVICAVLVPASASLPGMQAKAAQVDYLSEYEAIIYGTDNGLASAELNAVAQTPDGYLWVGSYSGLYRYDGSRFEKTALDERISSVMDLYVAQDGILWIGTNDSGLCRYDPVSGEIRFYTTEDGLPANAIRSLCENDRGDLYVGTVASLCIISADGETVDSHDEWPDISGVRSISHDGNGIIAGVSNGGTLFFLKDRTLIESAEYDEDGLYYAAVATDGNGNYCVGTSGNRIQRMTFDGEHIHIDHEIETGGISYYNHMIYDPSTNGFFFCAENGVGYLSASSKVTELMQDRFQSSISDAIIDYQGNIWFASNKQGMMEYSRNPFVNVFIKAGLPDSVVNSLLVAGDTIYIGMDTGLAVLDKNTYHKKIPEYLSVFDGVRIRHLMEDSAGNTWASTYSPFGLVRISPNGEIKNFTEAEGTVGGRFRFSMELHDGTILAASNMGLNYIEGDRVIKAMDEKDGLPHAQILSMVEEADGTIVAGSDGDGVYVIKDRTVIRHIGMEEGLGTLVILRIVPCKSGYLYVTSNAIYYDDGQTVTRLNAFPYSNNYDVWITDEGEAWISSSAGIFVVHVDDLIANGEYRYTLLDSSRGFDTTLTANAWNAMLDDSGTLLLCCTDGVRQISTETYNTFDESYYIRVNNVTCDETRIPPDADGVYVIPKSTNRIQIQASFLNFALSNPLVRIYLEGAKDEGLTVYQKELTPLSFTNLPYGDYTLHIQTLDSTDYSIIREETFAIRKEARITEYLAFRITAMVLAVFFVGFFVWWFLRMTIINRQYEEIRAAKDEAERANSAKSRFLANMSHEIRTPINTIMGMDEMILREDTSPEVAGYAQDIKHASESLLGLVNDILDLSKIESGKMNLVEQEYDTLEFIRGLTTMIRVRSAAKNLEFYTEIDPALPARLYGDDGKIRQVILNLLTNAVKYTEKGSFTLSIKQTERSDDRVTIHYSVKDTGIGVRQEDMDKLFSAFERLDEKRNSGIQGTGLGLDISRQFVALMGGELRCESVYGEGSTFFFTISQKIVNGEGIGEFKEKAAPAERKGAYVPLFTAENAHILAVDDNRMNLQVLTGLLRPTKVQLETAMSGQECLDKLAEKHFDLLLLDHMMPGMDGIETLHKLRQTDTEIPVLALTANAVSGVEEYYLNEGFQGYVAKPIIGRKLEEAILNFLPKELMTKESDV